MTSIAKTVSLTVLLLLPLSLQADAIYRYAVQLPDTEEAQVLNVSVGDGDIAITGYEDVDLIYRADEQQMVSIDHPSKSYLVLDMQTVRSLATTIEAALEKMKHVLDEANLPDEQRAAVEKQFRQQLGLADDDQPSVFEIRDSKRHGDANGIACRWWEVFEDQKLIREVCSASPSDLPDGEQSFEVMMGLARLQAEIFDELATAAPVEVPDNPFAMMKEMDGIPIISNGLNTRSLEGSMKLISAEKTSMADGTFRPPDGYQRQHLEPDSS